MKAEQNRKQECLSNIICFRLGDAPGCYGSSWEEADDCTSRSFSGPFLPCLVCLSQELSFFLFLSIFSFRLELWRWNLKMLRQCLRRRPALGDGRPQISCSTLARPFIRSLCRTRTICWRLSTQNVGISNTALDALMKVPFFGKIHFSNVFQQ